MTHTFSHRLETRAGDDRDASIAECGAEFPDVTFGELYNDRDARYASRRVADPRPFAVDWSATCPGCQAARRAAQPSWLRRLLRRIVDWLVNHAPESLMDRIDPHFNIRGRIPPPPPDRILIDAETSNRS